MPGAWRDPAPDPPRLLVTGNVDGERALDFGSGDVGTAQVLELTVDTFAAGLGQAVDILWVIDNSGSTGDAASVIASNLDEWFEDQLGTDAIDDWHLGVVSTDVGDDGHLRGDPRFITSNTANAQDLFAMAANLGGSGSGIEQPFHNVWMAFQPYNTSGGVNTGFLRDEAALALIFLCDEAEQSGSLQGWTPQDYLAEWQALKADPADVVVSSISGGLLGCTEPVGQAAPGIDFVTLSELTGGATFSVCDTDWAGGFQLDPWHSIGIQDRFDLSAAPILASLTVELGGIPLPADHWTFDPSLDRLVLDPAVAPDPGEELRISYVPEASCVN